MAKNKNKYKKITLDDLNSAVKNKTKIEISNTEDIKANTIIIIKRAGHKEPFKPAKLDKVVDWAVDGSVYMKEELLRDTEIKLHKEIRIQDMYQQLIVTAVNKISMLQPQWEMIAAKLQLLSYYKETYNISNHKEYPNLIDILDKGVEKRIYDKNTIAMYSTEELEELNNAIDPTRDLLFNYKGLVTFFDKYCLNYSKTKKLELPQITYMRVAMALMVEEKTDRIKKVIDEYNAVSKHEYTLATPIMLNALTPGQQLSSCVLNTVSDDSHNILDTGKNLGIYSKFKGGTALDISSMRASGSYIEGNQGYSSGPVAFIKFYESIMKAWNQGSTRPGSLCIYFSWWHLDAVSVLSLKSNGGTDENRARGLMYGLKLNQIFLDAVENDTDVYLFDPKDTPELVGIYGEEFNKKYNMYINKSSVRKKKIKARDLWFKAIRERSETGNIYLYHEENVNESSLLNRYIGSSNLCTEIVLPSRPSISISEELITTENGQKQIIKKYVAGEIALCNLSSVNLERWFYMTEEQRWGLIRTLVRALDNTVDIANYPVKEGKNSNLMYRYLGIGVLNFTNYLALHKLVIDTQEALEKSDELFDDLSYKIISVSVELAREKGRFEKFYETEWAKGILPIHKANKNALELTAYKPDMKKWDSLSLKVIQFGIRNAQLMAIAPTACQTKVSEIKTSNGVKSLETIMNAVGINHKAIEENAVQGWYSFNNKVSIPTRFGEKDVSRIWYNGKQPTRKIEFEDGNVYEFTLNHRLLVRLEDGTETWSYVSDLEEGMEIVEINP